MQHSTEMAGSTVSTKAWAKYGGPFGDKSEWNEMRSISLPGQLQYVLQSSITVRVVSSHEVVEVHFTSQTKLKQV